MIVEYTMPPTREQGTCVIIGKSSYMETARENALWAYNSMREHDGQPPLSALPKGTKITALAGVEIVENEKEDGMKNGMRTKFGITPEAAAEINKDKTEQQEKSVI